VPLVIDEFKEKEKFSETKWVPPPSRPLKYIVNAERYTFHQVRNELFWVDEESKKLFCIDLEKVREKHNKDDHSKYNKQPREWPRKKESEHQIDLNTVKENSNLIRKETDLEQNFK
jgi:hypothetical protein